MRGAVRLVKEGGPIIRATEELANVMRQKYPARLATKLLVHDPHNDEPIVATRELVFLTL